MALYVNGVKVLTDAPINLNSASFTNAYEALRSLFTMAKGLPILPSADWTNTVTGTGNVTFDSPTNNFARTGTTASSTARGFDAVGGALGASDWYAAGNIDFDKEFYLKLRIARYVNEAETTSYVHLKAATTHGDLAALGIGVKIINRAIWGESYGTEQGLVDLSVTMTSDQVYTLEIFHLLTSIVWYVDKVLKGTQSTAAKIPTGQTGGQIVVSIGNGVTGGVQTALCFGAGWLFVKE